METTRVDICYRPLRVAWVIRSGEHDHFDGGCLTHTPWGGRFNPIVVADRPDEARHIIDLFRTDMVWPIGDADPVKQFPKQFPNLPQLLPRITLPQGYGQANARSTARHPQ
jgi:hypothetical protein